MPVLGHAFTGVALARSLRGRSGWAPASGPATALFTPLVLALAYAPDGVSQIGAALGFPAAHIAAHSLPLGLVAALPLAAMLAAVTALRFGRAFSLVALSIALHDVLDALQSPERMPWWPLSRWTLPSAATLLPASLLGETIVLGAASLFALAWSARRPSREPVHGRVPSLVATSALVLAAAVTHLLRDRREQTYETAVRRLREGGAAESLVLLDAAARWPSTAKPGRIEYLRGEAYLRLGRRDEAERHYLRADAADPVYFWTVADLALFYASSEEPLAERRRHAAPYEARLRRDFASHWDLARVVARLEQELDEHPGALAPASSTR